MSNRRCCYCRRRIFLARNGEWYHSHNASVSCMPGWASTKATPGKVVCMIVAPPEGVA